MFKGQERFRKIVVALAAGGLATGSDLAGRPWAGLLSGTLVFLAWFIGDR